MFAHRWARRLAVCGAAACAVVLTAASPMQKAKPPKLKTTEHARYKIIQGDKEDGSESIDIQTWNNNTVVLDMKGSLGMAKVAMSQKASLTLEEETYFPISFHIAETVTQPTDTLHIGFTLNMFANVAVIGSQTSLHTDERRVVTPVGAAVFEPGSVMYWYGVMPLLEQATNGRQRLDTINPSTAKVEGGEVYSAGRKTLKVLGKEIPVTVFKAERDRLGPATLYVDDQQRIVRCEQNMSTFELTEWSKK